MAQPTGWPKLRRTRGASPASALAFVLAAAGLLEQREATTHANACELLVQLCPGTRVQRDRIYVRDARSGPPQA